jgi:hypothetical protein
VLGRLKAAMEARDMDRVRRVWTSITSEEVEALSVTFRRVNDITVEYALQSITRQGSRFTTTVQVTYRFGQNGNPIEAPTQIFELGESGSEWVIVASRVQG